MESFVDRAKRVKRDVEALEGFYSNFESFMDSKTGNACLTGYLMTRDTDHAYLVKVVIPNNYPYEAPEAFILKPELPKDFMAIPHYWGNGKPCLFHSSRWRPHKHTLKDVVDRVAQWLHKIEIWASSKDGKWPGLSAD